jgi:hypothetical protein
MLEMKEDDHQPQQREGANDSLVVKKKKEDNGAKAHGAAEWFDQGLASVHYWMSGGDDDGSAGSGTYTEPWMQYIMLCAPLLPAVLALLTGEGDSDSTASCAVLTASGDEDGHWTCTPVCIGVDDTNLPVWPSIES